MNQGSHQSFWAIMDDTLGGGSLHLMTSGVDKGPILFQEVFTLPPQITSRELQELQLKSCINLLRSRIQDILSGNFSLMAQGEGSSHTKSQIREATTLGLESTIKVSDLLKLSRATCNKNNGFWIETEEGSFQIIIGDVEYFLRE
jgi:methionyl-tRNA formyltransferase